MHTRSGQCEFTQGDRRCPAPASRRAGGRWRCLHHADWWAATQGKDQAQGVAILEDAERAYAKLRGTVQTPLPEAAPSAQGRAALASARALLAGVPLSQAAPELESDEARFARVRDWGLAVYRLTREGLEAEGMERRPAHEAAIGVLLVQALAWGVR